MLKRSVLNNFDVSLVVTSVFLIIVGLLAIFSTTYQLETTPQYSHFYQQLTWAILGFIFLVIAAFTPLRIFYALSYFLYWISIILLILVLFVYVPGVRAQRWIYAFGFYFQPSEIAKLTTVLALARFLTDSKVASNNLKDIGIAFGIILLPAFLIYKEPDLGSCFPFLGVIVPMLFWAGLPYFTTFSLIAPLISLLVISFENPWIFAAWMLIIGGVLYIARQDIFAALGNYVVNISVGIITPMFWSKLKPYQQKRILTFLNPGMDPRGAGYQVLQSQTAIGSGGLTGKGYLQGTQTQLRFLPEQHTDFIFTVIAEEFGLIGATICISCFFFLIYKGFEIAGAAKNHFASLTALGLTVTLFVHIFINLGMTVGLMPVTGLPLPFMTSGGSALLTCMVIIGILSNISVNRMRY